MSLDSGGGGRDREPGPLGKPASLDPLISFFFHTLLLDPEGSGVIGKIVRVGIWSPNCLLGSFRDRLGVEASRLTSLCLSVLSCQMGPAVTVILPALRVMEVVFCEIMFVTETRML